MKKDADRKKTLNVVLGIALLFFAVILAANAVQKIQSGAAFSAVIGVCGTTLFGGVGISLLAGEIRGWLKQKK